MSALNSALPLSGGSCGMPASKWKMTGRGSQGGFGGAMRHREVARETIVDVEAE